MKVDTKKVLKASQFIVFGIILEFYLLLKHDYCKRKTRTRIKRHIILPKVYPEASYPKAGHRPQLAKACHQGLQHGYN